jgi:hypothetical protein
MEGFWSLLRSWLRPHRGISQEKLPLYLGCFEFVHNVRKRGKALLGALIELLVTDNPGIQYEAGHKQHRRSCVIMRVVGRCGHYGLAPPW